MEQKRVKKGEHFNSKYPEKFKRKVIEEYLRCGCTKMDLVRKYKIRSKSGITSWMQDLKLIKVTDEPVSTLKAYLKKMRRNSTSALILEE